MVKMLTHCRVWTLLNIFEDTQPSQGFPFPGNSLILHFNDHKRSLLVFSAHDRWWSG